MGAVGQQNLLFYITSPRTKMIPEGREWFKCVGASTEALMALERSIEVELPKQYFELLAYSNGGEGALPVAPFTFCLDSAEYAMACNAQMADSDFPDFFIIGGNGGGELIGFDLRVEQPWRIVSIDATNINFDESVRLVARDFESLLQIVGLECDGP